jgi:phage regulator Rha-like protein
MDSVLQFIKDNTINLIDSKELAKQLNLLPGNLLRIIEDNKNSLLKIDELKEIELKRTSKKSIRYFYLTKAQAFYLVFVYRPHGTNKKAKELKETLLIQMIKSFV